MYCWPCVGPSMGRRTEVPGIAGAPKAGSCNGMSPATGLAGKVDAPNGFCGMVLASRCGSGGVTCEGCWEISGRVVDILGLGNVWWEAVETEVLRGGCDGYCWSISSSRLELLWPLPPQKMNGTMCSGTPARKASMSMACSTLRCSSRSDSWRVFSCSEARRSSSALATNQCCMLSVPCHEYENGGKAVDMVDDIRPRVDGGGRSL